MSLWKKIEREEKKVYCLECKEIASYRSSDVKALEPFPSQRA